jgi:hypothetical protein
MGFNVQRLELGRPVSEPLDIILCNGQFDDEVDIMELLTTFRSGFRLIIMNQPINRYGQSENGFFNPLDIGNYDLYPIGRWYDIIYGYSTMFRLKDCPVVKIKPIG